MGGDSRQRNEFAILSTISNQERRVFSKFHDFHVPRLHHCKPWSRSGFLLGLWIELRFCIHQAMISVAAGKILLTKTIRFFHGKTQLFDRKSTHSLRSTCHSTCPLSQRVLLSKRPSRLYESYYSPRGQAVSTSHFALTAKLAAGGEPSTRFPPGGLVEPAGIPDHSELPRLI